MRLLRGIAALAICVLAACPSSDYDDCPAIVDAPTDAFRPPDAPFTDAPPIDAPVDAVFDAPTAQLPNAREALVAVHVLTLLEARLDRYLVDGNLPQGAAGFTPGATCCNAGGGQFCTDNPAAWSGVPTWQAFEFSIAGPSAYVYSIASSGTDLHVIARGDLDCDGTFADISLTCSVANGATVCTQSYPAQLD